MIFLSATTDTLDLITSSAALIDYQMNFVEAVKTTGVLAGNGIDHQNNSISSATTTTVLNAPGASNSKTLKQGTFRNKDSSLSSDLTLRFNQNGTAYEIHKVTLAPGQCLEYIEGVGFFTLGTGYLQNSTYITADQVIGASVTAMIPNSQLAIAPSRPIQIGTVFKWNIAMSKTAAGVAAYTFNILFGTTGTTSDTSRVAFTTGNQTGVADQAFVEIIATVRGPIGASCIVAGQFMMTHNLSATGFDAVPCRVLNTTSAAFDCTTSGIIASLDITTGASNALTVQQVVGQVLNI